MGNESAVSSSDSVSEKVSSYEDKAVSDSSFDDNGFGTDSGEPETMPEDELKCDEYGKELPYDVTPVVDAYETGDTSALTPKQKKMLKAAQNVLQSIITDDMTAYEKELAIHDYIILNNCYNDRNLNIFGESDADDSTPYGMLINGCSICKGYAKVFELLCRMAGIECDTLVEYDPSNPNVIDHAFNRVYIEDGWYYVDTTWDDKDYCFEKSEICYKYFNLTKAQMSYNHDISSAYPDSRSTRYTYASQSHIVISSISELEEILKKYQGVRYDYALYILPDEASGIKLTFDTHGHNISSDGLLLYFEEGEIAPVSDVVNKLGLRADYAKVKAGDDIILRIFIDSTED